MNLGYNEKFLDTKYKVSHPNLSAKLKNSALQLKDGSFIRNYLHFSIVMHKERRMAIYSACNVGELVQFNRKLGRTRFFFDKEIDRIYQLGDDYYKGKKNKWDKGHLTRRQDVLWGADEAEIKEANNQSFCYTNAAPQHTAFHHRLWGPVEDFIEKHAREEQRKLCIFTGPLFTKDDMPFMDIKVPAGFWKIIALIHPDTKKLAVASFVTKQIEYWDDMRAKAIQNFKPYQVPLDHIEKLTGLTFDDLSDAKANWLTHGAIKVDNQHWREIVIEQNIIL